MSSKLHGLVWEGCAFTGMSLSRVAVMARLADFASDEGISWPAIETIQRQIGAKSKNTVKAAIEELEVDGWISKKSRKLGGRNLSNVYQLNVEKLEAAASAANAHYKPKRRAPQDIPNIDPSTVDASIVDLSTIDPSKIDTSTVGKKPCVDGAMVAPDPSVKRDPKSKRSCPVAPPPDDSPPDDVEPAQRVLNHFNAVTKSSYRDSKTTMGYIRGRLAEDYTADDLVLVVDYLTAKWLNDPKMSDYLRPKTLFGPENCVEYFEKAKKWRANGSPACVNGKWQINTGVSYAGYNPNEPGSAAEQQIRAARAEWERERGIGGMVTLGPHGSDLREPLGFKERQSPEQHVAGADWLDER